MEWTEFKIQVPTNCLDTVAAVVSVLPSGGLYIEDYSDLEETAIQITGTCLLDEDLARRDKNSGVLHLYFSREDNPEEIEFYLEDRLGAVGIPFEISRENVRDEDWADHWKKYFKPVEIGERLAVCPSWESYENGANRAVLTIDPGAAFGTGTHATTWLCLHALEKRIYPGCALLDIGCGSGILSIAGLLLGAATAVGVDIDGLSVKTSRENGLANGFAPPRYNVYQGQATEQVKDRYDIVVANIIADVIIGLLPDVKRLLTKDGLFITSGIIDTREKEIMDAFHQQGFSVVERREKNGWICLIVKCLK